MRLVSSCCAQGSDAPRLSVAWFAGTREDVEASVGVGKVFVEFTV